MELETSLPPPTVRLQQRCRNFALRTMTLPERHLIRLRSSTTFPLEYNTGIGVELNMPDWGTENRTHSQLWRIHHSIADIAPTATHLEIINHHAYPPWHQPLDPRRITTHISCQKKETEAETHTSLVNSLCNDPKHLLIYTDGLQTKNGSNGTGLVAIHANHHHLEARWNLGRHVEVYDSELLQATTYAKEWTRDPNNKSTNTI